MTKETVLKFTNISSRNGNDYNTKCTSCELRT